MILIVKFIQINFCRRHTETWSLSDITHCKKSHILVSSGKMIFLFSENMVLFFRRKMTGDLSQKIHGNIIYSSNALKRWSFFYHKEWFHFFFSKIWYFFYGRKMKDDLSQKIHRNMMFSVCSVKMIFLFLQIWNYLLSKNKRWFLPEKCT